MARISASDLPRNKHVDIGAKLTLTGLASARFPRIPSSKGANVEPQKVQDLGED